MMRSLAIVCLLVGTASAEHKILVTRTESTVGLEMRKGVEGVVLAMARQIDRGAGMTEVPFGELATTVGCAGDFKKCKDGVADTLGVQELIRITITPGAGGDSANVTVQRGGKGQPVREASGVIPSSTLEKSMYTQIGPLFGVRTPPAAKPVKARPGGQSVDEEMPTALTTKDPKDAKKAEADRKLEADRKSEADKKTDAERKLEADKKAEADKKLTDADRKKAEADRKKTETERKQIEADLRRAEAERKEADKRAEADRKKADAKKTDAQRRAEAEAEKRAEADRREADKRAEADRREAEKKAEAEKRAEADRRAEADKKAEADRRDKAKTVASVDGASPAPMSGPTDRPGRRGGSPYIAGAATGGILVLAGLVLWSSASDIEGEIARAPRATSADIQNILALEDKGDSRALWGNISFVAGAAVVGVCTYLYFKKPRRSDRSLVIAPTLLPGGGGFAVQLTR